MSLRLNPESGPSAIGGTEFSRNGLPSTNTSEIDQKSLKLSVKAWQKMVSFGAVFPMAIPGQNAHCCAQPPARSRSSPLKSRKSDHHEVEHGLRQLPVCLGSFQPNLLLLRFQRGFFFPAAAKHFSVVLHDLDANRCT
jgi:hypothetical protein